MPAKTSLDEVKQALTLKNVKDQLGSYALGLLIYEQSVYKKTYGQKRLPGPHEPELGFYYSIQLLDRLAETHQVEAVTMIQAILSFDTMGRYLLAEHSIELDGKPFLLMDVLNKYQIDVTVLKETALHNQQHTVSMAVLPAPSSPGLLTSDVDLHGFPELADTERRPLERQANKVRKSAYFHQQVAQFSLDFDLLSQPPGREAVREILLALSDLFEHAKMQDSSNLDALSVSNSNLQAMTPFLQENLASWLVLSLVQAPSTLIFNQRLQFLMMVFSALNNKMKSCSLPVNISGDVYLPFFTFSMILTKSVLKDHPLVLKNQGILQCMNRCHSPASMKTFLDSIHVPIGGKLSPMRILMMSRLATTREIASLNEPDGSPQNQVEIAANLHLSIGKIVYQYFNPLHHKRFYPLRCMLNSSRTLLQSQSKVALLCRKMGIYELADLLRATFAIHNTKVDIHEQLDALENALFMQTPRLFYYTKRGALENCAGQDAFNYIKNYVSKAQVSTTGYVAARCMKILVDIEDRCLPQPEPCHSASAQHSVVSPLVGGSMFSPGKLPDDGMPSFEKRKKLAH